VTAESRALVFFDQARAAFAESSRRGETRVAYYRIAGKSVRIASTSGFESVHRAFAHLRDETVTTPDLEITAWDQSNIPSPPWSTDDYGVRGEIRGFNDVRFRTAFDHMASSLSMLDEERDHAIFWTRDVNALPQADHGAPLKTILHWWLEEHERLFIHGGAVGNNNGAVLLAGEGGVGKSTTALLCAASGLNYLGDDYCAVGMSAPIQLYSLYATGKVAPADSGRFAKFGLTSSSPPHPDDKLLFYLPTTIDQLPLRAILVLRINPDASETTIRPSTSAKALKALAPSTISQLTGAGATTFERLAQLARTTPCFELSLARDFDHISEKISSLLKTQTR
jgi:hypothetical protein